MAPTLALLQKIECGQTFHSVTGKRPIENLKFLKNEQNFFIHMFLFIINYKYIIEKKVSSFFERFDHYNQQS